MMRCLLVALLVVVSLSQSDATCGGTLSTDRGTITSPNYPNNYNDNDRCMWTIVGQEGHQTVITFRPPFRLEGGDNCQYDHIKIYDVMPNETETLRATWCGKTIPNTISSTSSKMYVVFKTDGSNNFEGFKASFLRKSACEDLLDGMQGTITSPQYPAVYHNHLRCRWSISAPDGYFIELKLGTMNSDKPCKHDTIEIFDTLGDNTLMSRGEWCGTNAQYAMKSFGSKMLVTFNSDRNSTNNGQAFKILWRATKECHGVFDAQQGFIMSYNYVKDANINYNEHLACTWEISVPEYYRVGLKFDSPINASVCDYFQFIVKSLTFLTVFNEPSNNSKQIMDYSDTHKWCGENSTNDYVISSSHRMWINFNPRQDNIKGFLAYWNQVCGNIFHTREGSISSPDYGSEYPKNIDCEWTIEGRQYNIIHLYFQQPFDIEQSNDGNCSYDYVEVFDSFPNGTTVTRGKYCGTKTPPQLISSTSTVVLRFHSDGNKAGKGFSVAWDNACGEAYNHSQGDIMSPNYPSHFPGHVDCRWEIQVEKGNVIRLSFQQPFYMEDVDDCNVDYIEIFDLLDNGTQISKGRFCGSDIPPVQTSSTSRMVVTFQSDGRKHGAGFHAVWDAAFPFKECGEVVFGSHGNISSPNYGIGYPGNLNCEWTIVGVKNHVVHLYFNSPFDLENSSDCGFDAVEVFDSMTNGTLISRGRFCGQNTPPPMISSTLSMVIRLQSDQDKSGTGFSVSWDTACGDIYRGDNGYISSPNFLLGYPDNLDCRWEIQVDKHHFVSLSFVAPFSLNDGGCASDYIELHDILDDGTQTSKGRLCGNVMPPTYRSSTSRMAVIFHSDDSGSGVGFHGMWQKVCGEVFESDQGYFTSPEYPLRYPDLVDCRWEIKVNPGKRVRLQFDSTFDLEPNLDNCGYDSVEVLDYFSNGTSISNGRWCGVKKLPIFLSISSQLTVLFHSDFDKNGKGFNASWDTVGGCGDTFHKEAGYLLSPNYPQVYPKNLECRWEINSQCEGNVTLRFHSDFDLEKETKCSWDYLEIYEGIQLIGRWCGKDRPPTLTFSGQTIMVVFKSDRSHSGHGFFASWSTSK